MPSNDKSYNCRVCGLKQLVQPWGGGGVDPSRDICSCCGVEFGYEDCQKSSILKYRGEWLKNGAIWFSLKEKPEPWNLHEQLKSIPPEFQ